MCDEWMPVLKLPIPFDQFSRLPRNGAYKYEYFDGAAYLSPRPKFYHAVLELGGQAGLPATAGNGTTRLRPVRAEDWEGLVPVFAAAFHRAQPFGGLENEAREEAARKSLAHTREGGDGPWIEAASFVAIGPAAGDRPVGAALVTLLPDADPAAWGSFHWREPPPPDALARRLGRPHLTWIFVAPPHEGRGVGTSQLAAAARALLGLGYRRLASTFLLGNESSMLWHWRTGFRLAAYPGSLRRPPPAE